MNLEGKVAIVTGASRGIGAAIVKRLAADGAKVVAVARSIETCEGAALCMKVDVSDTAQVDACVKATIEKFGHVDILVNNAGITKDGLMLRMSELQWDAVLTVNLKSAFNFIHAVSPVMLRQRGGSIINISSIVGVHGNAGQCNYSASKAGMIGLAKSIAAELGPKGVRANVVAPGFILTEMTEKLGPEVLKQWEAKIPMRRGGTPAEVAKVCTFLASDLASYVSGQVILVDGGMGM